MKDTKERILQEALRLFAADGYEAVSVQQIATALGITKGALYKHYQNKRAIFDSILARMEAQDAAQAADAAVPEKTLADDAAAYENTSMDALFTFSRAQFRYWTEDAFAAPFRRMLTLEQYRNPEMGQLYQQYLAAGPLRYVVDILQSLGLQHPQEKAVALYAPMFLLYSIYDGAAEKEIAFAALDVYLTQLAETLEEELHS